MRNASNRDPWFVYPRPSPQADLRLFCFPYAGGAATIYYSWPNGLPKNIEVCAVQLPGRGGRLHEPSLTRIEAQVDAIFNVIHPHLDKPFAFWGHSMGAVLAFELARKMAAVDGVEPVHLFVSGSKSPQAAGKRPSTYNLPEPELLEELERLNGTPKEVLESPELMQLMLPILRADLEAIETYVYSPSPPLNCPMTVFGGLQDQEATREGLEGWREHTTGPFSVRMLPGDHFFLHTARPLIFMIIQQELYQNMTSF